jgi:hypothetical protein
MHVAQSLKAAPKDGPHTPERDGQLGGIDVSRVGRRAARFNMGMIVGGAL